MTSTWDKCTNRVLSVIAVMQVGVNEDGSAKCFKRYSCLTIKKVAKEKYGSTKR